MLARALNHDMLHYIGNTHADLFLMDIQCLLSANSRNCFISNIKSTQNKKKIVHVFQQFVFAFIIFIFRKDIKQNKNFFFSLFLYNLNLLFFIISI